MSKHDIARQMANAPRQQNRPAPDVQVIATAPESEPLAMSGDEHDQAEPDPAIAPAPAAAKQSRRSTLDVLNSMYPVSLVAFKMNKREPGDPWKDGTVSQTLADATITMVDPVTGLSCGVEIRGSRIVKKTNPKHKEAVYDLQTPSTGTGFRSPIFNSDEDDAKDGLNRWKRAVGSAWVVWRKAAVAAAKAAGELANVINVSESGVRLSADEEADLSL